MKKEIQWQKMWKQRDKTLNMLEYHRIGKSVIKQASTLIISDLFDKAKSKKWFRMNKAKVKVRGYVFGFRVNYGVGWYDKEPSIHVTAYCDNDYHERNTLVIALAKELRTNLTIVLNNIEELRDAFIIGMIR